MNEPRILIVGTVPYNEQQTSRAFNAYFFGWDKEKLAQIFSNTRTPLRGHCAQLYQITDKRLVEARFHRNVETGKLFFYDDLRDNAEEKQDEINSAAYRKLYKLGAKKTPLVRLGRKLVWKKKLWMTNKLLQWLDGFAPECVFLSFSDDFFIPEIALFAAKRYNIPVISSIGDDYYFNDRFSISPAYHLYRFWYKRLIDSVFAHGGSAIYISDKIRDKYNAAFHMRGQTVYLASKLERKPFAPVKKDGLTVSYFGNIRQGRNESLCDIADALARLSPAYHLDVYSNQNSSADVTMLKENPHIRFHGAIPYEQVRQKTAESDIVVVVESFREKYINNTRYSLSTKAADSLASGAQILVYGSPDCGIIEYFLSNDCAAVCTDKAQLLACVRRLIEDPDYQMQNYLKAAQIYERNHLLLNSTQTFRSVVEEAIGDYANTRG